MGSRRLRHLLVQGRGARSVYDALAPSPGPGIVTLTRGDGKIEIRRGSKGEELLRKAGWREIAGTEVRQ